MDNLIESEGIESSGGHGYHDVRQDVESLISGFVQTNPQSGLTQIANGIDIPKTIVYNVLAGMRRNGTIVRSGEGGEAAYDLPGTDPVEIPVTEEPSAADIDLAILTAIDNRHCTLSQIHRYCNCRAQLEISIANTVSAIYALIQSNVVMMLEFGDRQFYFRPDKRPKRVWLEGDVTGIEWLDEEAKRKHLQQLIDEKNEELQRNPPPPEPVRSPTVGQIVTGVDHIEHGLADVDIVDLDTDELLLPEPFDRSLRETFETIDEMETPEIPEPCVENVAIVATKRQGSYLGRKVQILFTPVDLEREAAKRGSIRGTSKALGYADGGSMLRKRIKESPELAAAMERGLAIFCEKKGKPAAGRNGRSGIRIELDPIRVQGLAADFGNAKEVARALGYADPSGFRTRRLTDLPIAEAFERGRQQFIERTGKSRTYKTRKSIERELSSQPSVEAISYSSVEPAEAKLEQIDTGMSDYLKTPVNDVDNDVSIAASINEESQPDSQTAVGIPSHKTHAIEFNFGIERSKIGMDIQMPEMVDHPRHYNANPSGVECIDVIEHLSFNIGSAMKYLWRLDEKGDAIENLKKAVWYCQREIQRRSR